MKRRRPRTESANQPDRDHLLRSSRHPFHIFFGTIFLFLQIVTPVYQCVGACVCARDPGKSWENHFRLQPTTTTGRRLLRAHEENYIGFLALSHLSPLVKSPPIMNEGRKQASAIQLSSPELIHRRPLIHVVRISDLINSLFACTRVFVIGMPDRQITWVRPLAIVCITIGRMMKMMMK